MSGFVALLDGHAGAEMRDALRNLTATLAFRGPDGLRSAVMPPVGMGESLLAADPGAACGPHSLGESLWLCGDIRIDGQEELRAALRRDGERPEPDGPDGMLVLHAYRAWGTRVASALLGDFAFALWDAERRRLLCARDALGVKLFYYARPIGAFVCSNTLATVLAHPAVARELHLPALEDFLRTGFNEDVTRTSIRDVRRRPPGHTLVAQVDRSAPRIERYWSFPESAPDETTAPRAMVERCRTLLDVAVRDRVRGSRVGILMSGGLDSPSIAAAVKRTRPGCAVHAWTNVHERIAVDHEGEYSRLATSFLGIAHTVRSLDDMRPLTHLSDRAPVDAEPFDISTMDSYRAHLREASGYAPVLLFGEDADTVFEAPTFVEMWRRESRPGLLARIACFAFRRGRLPYLGTGVRRRLLELRSESPPKLPRWVRASPASEPQDTSRHSTTALERHLQAPVWQWFFESIDAGVTRAPVEVRLPLIDLRLIAFATTVPGVPLRQGKLILRRAARGALPDAVIRRPKAPLRGGLEQAVENWRAGGPAPSISHAVALDLVDSRALTETLERGSAEQVVHAWRALELDDWLRRRDAGAATAGPPAAC